MCHWHIVHRRPPRSLVRTEPFFRRWSTTNNRLTFSITARYLHYICIHTYVHSMDPLVCHKDCSMGNRSWIHKYTNLQCKILQTFYKNIIIIVLFIVRLTQQYDVKLSYVQLIKLHVSTPWGHLQAYKIWIIQGTSEVPRMIHIL